MGRHVTSVTCRIGPRPHMMTTDIDPHQRDEIAMISRNTKSIAAPANRSGGVIGEELRAMVAGLMITAVGAMMGLGAAYAFHII